MPHGAGGRSTCFRVIHLFATNMLVLQLSFILWPRRAANQKSKNTNRIGSMRALHRWSALNFRNPALRDLNQNLESTAIHGWCLRRTVFLTVCLLFRPRHPKCSSRWITIPTNQSCSRIRSVSLRNFFPCTTLQDSGCSAEGSNDLLNPVYRSTGNKGSPARGSTWVASAPAAL